MVDESPFAHLDRAGLIKAPQAIDEFVRRLPKRRPDNLVALPVIVQPMNEGFQAVGGAFKAILDRVSMHEASVMHQTPITAPFIVLEWIDRRGENTNAVQLVLKVVRCERSGPMYLIGGRFMTEPPMAVGEPC
jgi:hypothetical protein